VKLLTNPIFVRMAAAFFLAVAAFVGGIFGLRVLRRRILDDDVLSPNAGQENTLYPYSVVIQQLKQQKFELQTEQQTQRRRSKTSEQITSAVIANLPCGVLFVAPNGLIKQANAAARRILGFASPLGLGLDELFRDATYVLSSGESGRIADLFKKALQGQTPSPFEGRYCAARGEERTLGITLIALNAPSGEALGLASVITDESSIADSRRAQLLHGEISAEMALELRSSLAAIRECAGQMSATNDQRSLATFATDISSEAERLERLVGGFLAGSGQAKASAVGA
jgi:two-component system, NtrC family, nitrogen regulation sensor histidine kinase NtrY